VQLIQQQRRFRQILVIGFAVFVVLVDQLSKELVIRFFEPGQLAPLLGDVVRFNLVFNDSAAFSIGFGATAIFTVISTVAALALLWYSKRIETKGWAILLGVALGGVTGNLIDRLTRAPGFATGHVVDFIQIPFNFPVFNLADSAIFVAAVITVIRVMRGERIGKAKHDE
jgi:signal peptidase II